MDITKFGLSNFRVFKEHFDFDLAPIMVLTGPNNSGKSSVSKALLLLKENEYVINCNSLLWPELNYFKGEHDLGNHKYTINTQGECTIFSFTFFLDYKFYIEISNEGFSIFDYKITTNDGKLIICQSDNIITIEIKRIIAFFKDRIDFTRTNMCSDSLDLDFSVQGKSYWNYLAYSEIKRLEDFINHLEDFSKDIASISIDFLACSCLAEKNENPNGVEFNFDSDGINLEYFDEHEKQRDYADWLENLIYLFHKMTSMKLTADDIQFLVPSSKIGFFSFQDLIYVNTIKEPLKRAYSRNDVSMFQILISKELSRNANQLPPSFEPRVRIKALKQGEIDTSKLIFNRTYEIFLQKWLKEFEIGEELTYGYDEENDIFFIKVDNKSLPEYGLGYGLIIHILLALSNEIKESELLHVRRRMVRSEILKLNFPATYIVEEPETGLHPAFQSKMAEMIVDAKKTFGINFIIETHSEYFIRKLQFLTATNVINPGDAVIYYFNNPKKVPENEEQIKKITIAENGSLSDTFGPGFMDEGTNLKFDLLRTLDRQQN